MLDRPDGIKMRFVNGYIREVLSVQEQCVKVATRASVLDALEKICNRLVSRSCRERGGRWLEAGGWWLEAGGWRAGGWRAGGWRQVAGGQVAGGQVAGGRWLEAGGWRAGGRWVEAGGWEVWAAGRQVDGR